MPATETVPSASFPPTDGPLTPEELQLAGRNRGTPLEALRYDITPSGLHYLLIHFDIPAIDAATWSLSVGGAVARPFGLSLDEIRALPRVTSAVTLECAGNGRARLLPRPISQPWLNEAVATAEWTGTPLAGVLERARVERDAVEIVFNAVDRGVERGYEHHYARSLAIADAMRPEVLLVYEMNGRPLEPQHGFPLRLIVPGWYGMTQVKWLTGIEAVCEPFLGYQQHIAYHYRSRPDEQGIPVQRMRPRALLLPPGVPDFLSRRRIVESGPCRVEGRAWSGAGPVVKVAFGVDGNWMDAELDPPVGPFAWRRWSCTWNAAPGDHVLSCRATDAAGDVQPTEQAWTWNGVGNNLVQMVPVSVR